MSMTSKRRKCCSDPNAFCYICGCFTYPRQRRNINSFIKRIYLAYFETLKSWSQRKNAKLKKTMQEKHLLKAGTSVSFYRNREEKFRKFFYSDGQLVYSTDVEGILAMGLSAHHLNDWRLFIDSSKEA